MLKFKSISNDNKIVSIEFDDYIPFDINIGKPNFQKSYFRYGDGKRSLLEIGVNAEEGVMSSCTLTVIKRENIKRLNSSFKIPDYALTKDIVIFDITKSNKCLDSSFIDTLDSDLYLDLGNNYISVRFSISYCKVESYIINDRLVVGFNNSKELCIIAMTQLSLSEIEKIKASTGLI